MFFYSSDRAEPPHVHVERSGRTVKLWLAPLRLADAGGVPGVELRRVRKLVARHRAELLRSWHAFFGN
jgi:hypothetical protein